ncbi:MAG: inositol monophosphatase [bacterium]|nr:inositol monophosphatase [bacterium]
MDTKELNSLLHYLRIVILKAGDILLSYYGKVESSQIITKSSHDFVSIADKSVEEFLYHHLEKEFPEFGFICEEGIRSDSNSIYRWIIDPLDGTTNFLRQIPIFAISIALEEKGLKNSSYGERILGIVYNPVLKQLWYAVKNLGAFCNEARISVNHSITFDNALLATGFPFRSKHLTKLYIQAWEKMFLACSSMRRCGSAAIDMCWVANGIVDGFWELNLSPWDIAAGEVIIKEAGGIVGSFSKNADPLIDGCIWCSAPQVYEKGLMILKSVFGEEFTPLSYVNKKIDIY